MAGPLSVQALPMSAGSALVFSPLLWHFTDQNRTQHRRRALQYHFVSADTTSLQPSVPLWPLVGRAPKALVP